MLKLCWKNGGTPVSQAKAQCANTCRTNSPTLFAHKFTNLKIQPYTQILQTANRPKCIRSNFEICIGVMKNREKMKVALCGIRLKLMNGYPVFPKRIVVAIQNLSRPKSREYFLYRPIFDLFGKKIMTFLEILLNLVIRGMKQTKPSIPKRRKCTKLWMRDKIQQKLANTKNL